MVNLVRKLRNVIASGTIGLASMLYNSGCGTAIQIDGNALNDKINQATEAVIRNAPAMGMIVAGSTNPNLTPQQASALVTGGQVLIADDMARQRQDQSIEQYTQGNQNYQNPQITSDKPWMSSYRKELLVKGFYKLDDLNKNHKFDKGETLTPLDLNACRLDEIQIIEFENLGEARKVDLDFMDASAENYKTCIDIKLPHGTSHYVLPKWFNKQTKKYTPGVYYHLFVLGSSRNKTLDSVAFRMQENKQTEPEAAK